MSGILTRRSLLAGAGFTAAYGTLAARMLSLAEAQEAQPAAAAPKLSLNMIFPNPAKAKIDDKRVIKKHLPLLRQVYGDSVERIEFRTVQSPTANSGLPPSSMLASTHLWIRDVPGFSTALGANNQAINLDLDVAAKGPRIAQVDRLVAAMGEELSQVKEGSQLLTVFFRPVGEQAFDEDYFVKTHIPKVYSMFGQSAVRRLTATSGVDQGSKATYRGTVTLYVRERSAYESAIRSALGEMVEDIKKFTNIIPEFNELRIQAIV